MQDKYVTFFNTVAFDKIFVNSTPEEKSEILYKFIYVDNIEYKEESNITMTYNKEFKEQFKNLEDNEDNEEDE